MIEEHILQQGLIYHIIVEIQAMTIQIVFDFSIIQMDFRPEQFGRITIKI